MAVPGGMGLASKGACKRCGRMEHPKVPGGLVCLLGHVGIFQTLEN